MNCVGSNGSYWIGFNAAIAAAWAPTRSTSAATWLIAATWLLPIPCNCDILTASVGAWPGATLVILLPPLFNPSLVKYTLGAPPAGAIVIPLPLVIVVLPAGSVNVADVIPDNTGLTA